MLRRLLTLVLVAVAALPAAAAGVPSLSDGTIAPASWTRNAAVLAGWSQNDFDGEGLGPALVQVNSAPDGSADGEWVTRHSIEGPLASGGNGVVSMPVAGLEGRHRVRVVVDGARDSPLPLGTLQLDRTAPAVTDPHLQYVDATAVVSWTQADGLSGIDPDADARLEVNSSPLGDDAGTWSAVTPGPARGEGRRTVRIPTAALTEGVHRIRAVVPDRAGNIASQALGVVYADRRAPAVSVSVVRAPTVGDPLLEVQVDATDPAPGSGVAADAVAELRSADDAAFLGHGVVPGGHGRLGVRLPGAGIYDLSVRIGDRAGRMGRSAAFRVEVPRHVGPVADPDRRHAVAPVPLLRPRGGEALGPGARAAYAAARRLHARRGVALRARALTARSAAAWRSLLGARDAHRYVGYATFRGQVLLGPSVSAGLEDLWGARAELRRSGTGPPAAVPSRLDLDRMAMALAVLLHETLHATGPAAIEDVRDTPSGRGFEEGFTEAVTIDLLPRYTRSLALPARLRGPLLAAVRRYRPASPAHVAWARHVSGVAVAGPPAGAAARAFRLAVADTWGADRWTRLSALTGIAEIDLRTGATPVRAREGPRR